MALTLPWTPVLAAGGGLVPLLVVLFIVISAVRAAMQAQRARAEHEASGGDSEEERRAREIRERLRRVIEERRGVNTGAPAAGRSPESRRIPGGVPPLEPFGGALRRLVQELAPPPPPLVEPPLVEARPEPRPEPETTVPPMPTRTPRSRLAGLPSIASGRTVATEEIARRAEARDQVLEDLRDPRGLRRAFVLREVLGPPVSMRGVPRRG